MNSVAQECGTVARDPTSASGMNSRKESQVTTAGLFQLEWHVCHGRATAGMTPKTLEPLASAHLKVGCQRGFKQVDVQAGW